MWKRVVTLSLVVVTILSFTACNGGDEDVSELPSAQEIIDSAVEAEGDVESGRFEMSMSMEATGEEEGEAVEMVMVMDFNGAVDLASEEMSADVSMSIDMSGEEEMAMEMAVEMYVVDGMAYIMMDMPEMEPMWMKEEMGESGWEEANQMLIPTESYLELLETADVAVIGSERVKGVDCYVLELTPNLEQLWATAMQQAEVAEMDMPSIAEDVLQEAFTSFSVKQWFAKDTYFLVKSEIVMSMEVTPELVDIMGDDSLATMDITVTFLSYDHNQSISIVLPQEALDL
jgi:hypothetical protein